MFYLSDILKEKEQSLLICHPMHRIRALLLASACAVIAGSCATPPTVEVIAVSSMKEYRTPAQSYNLSEHERRLCEKKASHGDIMAAKKLVTYHMMVTANDREVRYWLEVVARLQKNRVTQNNPR